MKATLIKDSETHSHVIVYNDDDKFLFRGPKQVHREVKDYTLKSFVIELNTLIKHRNKLDKEIKRHEDIVKAVNRATYEETK